MIGFPSDLNLFKAIQLVHQFWLQALEVLWELSKLKASGHGTPCDWLCFSPCCPEPQPVETLRWCPDGQTAASWKLQNHSLMAHAPWWKCGFDGSTDDLQEMEAFRFQQWWIGPTAFHHVPWWHPWLDAGTPQHPKDFGTGDLWRRCWNQWKDACGVQPGQ